MKLNWGWAIVIVLTLFIAMILQFVFRSFNERIDLVSEDYYEKELNYQTTIDKEKNLNLLEGEMECKITAAGILIVWPSDFDGQLKNGKVKLYRPSDERLDKSFDLIDYSDSEYLIPIDEIVSGKWEVIIDFSSNDKNYFYKKVLLF